MIDELIKYDTALLAQEKGFDVQTYANCWIINEIDKFLKEVYEK